MLKTVHVSWRGKPPQNVLETRVLDRINFFSLQKQAFWSFFEFILSKTRVLDRINFFSL